jgi:hypothetical protein
MKAPANPEQIQDLVTGRYRDHMLLVIDTLGGWGVIGATASQLRGDINDPAVNDRMHELLGDLHNAGIIWRFRKRTERGMSVFLHDDFAAEYGHEEVVQSPMHYSIEKLLDDVDALRQRINQLHDERHAMRRRLIALGVIQEPEDW